MAKRQHREGISIRLGQGIVGKHAKGDLEVSNSEELNEYGLREYSFEIGSIDDSSETVAIVGQEYSSISEDEKFYRKEDADALLARLRNMV